MTKNLQHSSPSIAYADLLHSGISLSEFARVCGVSKITTWKLRGIPSEYQKTLFGFLKKRNPETLEKLLVPKKTAKEQEKTNSFTIQAEKAAGLGTLTKFTSTHDDSAYSVDLETGEIVYKKSFYDPVLTRLERFRIHSFAQRILRNSKASRVSKCLCVPLKGSRVQVYRSVEYQSTFYAGLSVCGSVWTCPVCAAKISERRRFEVMHAINQHKAVGGDVLLLTLTTPHKLQDKLVDVLAGQKKALNYFTSGRAAASLRQSIGSIGQIRALEVTHGRLSGNNNGWHPHYHILLFVRSGLDLNEIKKSFFPLWVKACIKAGLSLPSWEHGIKLDNGEKAAAYVAKMGLESESKSRWGLESEMTKGHIKKAKSGETPFDFLRAVMNGPDRQAEFLFREFAEAFKGKCQLHWSKGLKAQFQVVEASDEEIAAKREDKADLVGTFEHEDWQLVLKHDARGEVLELARHGWDAVERFLIYLRKNVTEKQNE